MSDNTNSGPESASPASGAPMPAAAPADAPSTWRARLRAALVPWGLGIGAAAGALAGVYVYWSAHQDFMQRFGSVDGGASEARAAWGQYGDYLGGTVNPTLGLLTLMALVATVWLQMHQVLMSREQLALSRKELELTRRELERSADAQRDAAAALREQLEIAEHTARTHEEAAQFQLATARAMNDQAGYARVTSRVQALSALLTSVSHPAMLMDGNQRTQQSQAICNELLALVNSLREDGPVASDPVDRH